MVPSRPITVRIRFGQQIIAGTMYSDPIAGNGVPSPLDVPAIVQEGSEPVTTLPNIVLVHGAWADGSSWSAVIERLQADGYNVTAPQFPLTAAGR